VLAILALIGPCTAPLSYAAGPWLRSEDALAPLMNTVVLPLLLLSGILLPMTLAPDWLQTLASINPFSHAVNAARSLFNGQFGDSEVAIGVAVTIVLAGVSLWIASRSFSRAAA
jgi:ABC-2 type transport system permease protein